MVTHLVTTMVDGMAVELLQHTLAILVVAEAEQPMFALAAFSYQIGLLLPEPEVVEVLAVIVILVEQVAIQMVAMDMVTMLV